jgi:hypothetical protein
MKGQNRLTSRTQAQEQALTGQKTQPETAREFATAEELLRHDALHTPVPPRIAHRLQESIGKSAPPPGPWWRRIFREPKK